MSFNALLGILKSGKSFYSAEAVDRQISAIFEQIKTIYLDVSDAHIAAARAALKSEESRYNQKKSIEIAIPHLVAAYTISKKALGLTKKSRILFVFTVDENLISYNEKPRYLSYLALLGGEISILYKKIGQINNSKEWYNIAVNDYQASLDLFYSDLENLKSISSSYVHEWKDIDSDDALAAAHTDGFARPKHHIEITIEGEKYRIKENQKKMKIFMDVIRL